MKKATAPRRRSAPLPRVFSVIEVAEALSVTRQTVHRWRQTGILPPFLQLGPGRVGLPEEAFRSYLASCQRSLVGAHAGRGSSPEA